MKKNIKNNCRERLLRWVDQFVAGVPHLTTNNRRNYRITLCRFLTYLEKNSRGKYHLPMSLKREIIGPWLREMRQRHTFGTVLGQVRTVNRFLSFLKKNGLLHKNPLARLKDRYPQKGLKGVVLALLGPSPRNSLEALQLPPRFTSPLGHDMQKFISLGRSQGKLYLVEETILCRFDRFLKSHRYPPKRLSDSVIRKWIGLFYNRQPQTRCTNFEVVRRFCLYLCRFDPKTYVPDVSLNPSPPPPFVPYIYSRAEIVALLKAARKLNPSVRSPIRPQMMYFLILLLYTTGMRLGEALRLQLRDIDWNNLVLHIRQTKFFKSRFIPLSASTMRELKQYIHLRERAGAPTNPESPLLQNPRQERPYSHSTVQCTFRCMLREIGLKPSRGVRGPRIHDLRATFAVHRIEEWYRQGEDVQSKLGLLSTYLGHVGIASTQRYLPMTTELLGQASRRFNKHFNLNTNRKES